MVYRHIQCIEYITIYILSEYCIFYRYTVLFLDYIQWIIIYEFLSRNGWINTSVDFGLYSLVCFLAEICVYTGYYSIVECLPAGPL